MTKRPTNAELTAELERVRTTAAIDIQTLREQWNAADQNKHATLAAANKTIAELEAEVNGLRDKLLSAYLDSERFRGYLDGQADMQPPRMVPEQREPRTPYREANTMSVFDDRSNHYDRSERRKAWYHR